MKTMRRLRVAGILFVVSVSVMSGRAGVLDDPPAIPYPALDRALGANKLDEARRLVPESWALSEQLFVWYLERAYLPANPKRPDLRARTRAGRLADVLFAIIEYDFAKSIVADMDTANTERRQRLMGPVREYFTTLDPGRRFNAPSDAHAPYGKGRLTGIGNYDPERRALAARLTAAADQFRDLGAHRAEFFTLRSLPYFDQANTKRVEALADQLGDDLSLVWKRTFTEATLAMADRLRLPRRQIAIITGLPAAWSGSSAGTRVATPDVAEVERACALLERARALERGLPDRESVKDWLVPAQAPRVSRSILPLLAETYATLKRPEDIQPLVVEALDRSRPFGERAEVATMSAFVSRLRANFQPILLDVGRSLGPLADLRIRRELLRLTDEVPPETAQDFLARTLAVAGPYDRALTLRWYSYNALHVRVPGSPVSTDPDGIFTEHYRELRALCLASNEFELTAEALANEAQALIRLQDLAQAGVRYRQAIDLASRAGNWWMVAEIANTAAGARGVGGLLTEPARAEFARTAVQAATKAGDQLRLVRALRAAARTVPEAQQAVAAAHEFTAASGQSVEERSSLLALAELQFRQGAYEGAIESQRREAELAARETTSPGYIPPALTAYWRLAWLYAQIGEPAQARAEAERVRAMVAAINPERVRTVNPNPIAHYHRQLGDLERKLGDPLAALRDWSQALESLDSFKVKDSPQLDRRGILESRATLLAVLGDFDASLRDWQAVLPLIPQTRQNYRGYSDIGHMVAWKTAVAWTHALAGEQEEALKLAREALADLRGDSSGLWAGQLYDGESAEERLLHILLLSGHAEEAIPVFAALRQTPLIEPQRDRMLVELQARAHAALGQFDQARALLREADRRDPIAFRALYGPGSTLLALGQVELGAGNPGEARRLLGEAPGEARRAQNPFDRDRVWQTERALGMAAAATGDLPKAEVHYSAALTVLESIREQRQPLEFRLRYGFDRSQIYDEHAALLAARAEASGRQEDAVAAFQAAERKRTQVLSSLLATGWSRLPPDALPDQVRRARELEDRLSAKEAVLREQFAKPPDERDAIRMDRLGAEAAQIHVEHARLMTALAQGQYRYQAPATVAASLAAPVAAALGPSRALVEYLLLDDRSYAFVVSSAGVKVVPLGATRARVRADVQRLTEPFRQLRAGDVDLTRLTYDTQTAYALYQTVFAPVRAALGTATDILVVPDDVLHVLPFEALVDRLPGQVGRGGVQDPGWGGVPFLVRRHTMSYLTSAAELLSAGSAVRPVQGPAGSAPQRLFVLANPTAGAVPVPPPAQDDPAKGQFRSAGLAGLLTPLPSAEAEAERIARVFPPGASAIVTRDKATEAAYASRAGEYDVVHFATHGVASDAQPLYSTLVLAPDTATGSDGFLHAYEVLRTPLRAKLVVLGGCETALGGGRDSGQGLVGLAAAFQQVGARSVLATLWTIDQTTVDMMAAFYEGLAKGQSAPAALRQAKLHMLQRRVRMGKSDVSLAHPFFWAPFKLVGTSAR